MAGTFVNPSSTKTDPELTRQLDEARGTDRAVEAVVMLRSEAGGHVTSAETVQDAAESASNRVEEEVGSPPIALNVLKNLGMAVVVGNEVFVRKFLEQPEIESAVANVEDGRADY